MDVLHTAISEAASFGSAQLLTLPNGLPVSLSQGYIPTLVTFTFEDKAAKGLRKRGADAQLERPKYLSALEIVRENKFVLLAGSAGGGKTTFAKHLCNTLASSEPRPSRDLVRNDFGDVEKESWEEAAGIVPVYHAVQSSSDLARFVATVPELLKNMASGSRDTLSQAAATACKLQLVIDGIEKTGGHSTVLLTNMLSLSRRCDALRVLVLGDIEAVNSRPPPPDIARFDLRGFLRCQRKAFIDAHLPAEPENQHIGLGMAAENPSIFSIALRTKASGELCETTLDRLLRVIAPDADAAQQTTAGAWTSIHTGGNPASHQTMPGISPEDQHLLLPSRVETLMAALHLSSQPPETLVHLFRQDSVGFSSILRSILTRLAGSGDSRVLMEALIEGGGVDACRGALLVADFCEPGMHSLQLQIRALVLRVVSDGLLSARERDRAGRILSRLGDPRDLTAVVDVPGGAFTFGSQSHPNSQPVSTLLVAPFCIGQHPVVNRDYAAFVRATGRPWQSPHGRDPDRQNAPATDVTWHDARAYCQWLTGEWRREGRLSDHQIVRLPTEAEWERAARGDQQADKPDDAHTVVYPWGSRWMEDCANDESAGLNDTCCVGMFPEGRSSYSCYDMAGQVWEWCTTLWGEDMATPSFKNPWVPGDGREDTKAPESIRRVLRGGCFSSGILKACSTYKGSLEPAGFWRGNGFRIVVSHDIDLY